MTPVVDVVAVIAVVAAVVVVFVGHVILALYGAHRRCCHILKRSPAAGGNGTWVRCVPSRGGITKLCHSINNSLYT